MNTSKAPLVTINESGESRDEDDDIGGGVPVALRSIKHSLFESISKGDAETLKELITLGIDLNDVRDGEISPIMCAVMSQRPAILKILLGAGAKVNIGDNWEALHWAVHLGDVETAKLLLQAGINPDTIDADNSCYTPLTRAAKAGNIYGMVLIETLIQHGCAVNKQGFMGNTALHIVLEEGMYEAVPLLLEKGADPSIANDFKRSCLEVVVSSQVNADIRLVAEIFEVCCQKWSTEEAMQYHLDGALYAAVKKGRTDLVSFLLKHGASPECGSIGPRRAENVLQLTCISGDNVEMLKLLIDAGVPLNERDRKLAYPIHAAIENRRLKTLKLFLQLGANPNVRRFKALETPLILSIKRDYDEGALVLIQSSCDVNQPGYDRLSPLYYEGETVMPVEFALNRHRWIVVRALVVAGCDRGPIRIWLQRVLEEGYVHYGEEAIQEVRCLVTQPMSLKDQTRIFIRNRFSSGLLKQVHKLPIPLVLRSFVLMNEFISVDC